VVLGDGPDAPVIEVAPVAAAAGTVGAAGARPAGPQAMPERTTSPHEDETWPREDPDEFVPVSVGVTTTDPRRRRAPPRWNNSSMGWTIALTLVILGGAGAALWKFRPREERPAPAPVVRNETPRARTTAPATAPTPTRSKATIFDAGWPSPEKQTAGPTDPRKQHQDWVALEKALNGPWPARAILAIHEYRRKHPGQFEAELQAYMDDTLDRMWWQRVKELCDRRDQLQLEIRQLSSAIAGETSADFRKVLEGQRAQQEDVLRWQLEMLTKEMGYVRNETPNVADEEMMRHLRAERDSTLYEAWKSKELKTVLSAR
jgi:hypothetical protein